MALTELQTAQTKEQLTAYCAKRVPPAARAKVRLGYRIEGSAVALYEERPAFLPPHDWREMVIAKFTYVGTRARVAPLLSTPRRAVSPCMLVRVRQADMS